VTGGPGTLLVSPFNVKWRFSEPAGGVEESKLCLFSVFMPAKCVSSVSPRFHYRRLAFCFLPLAAILESFLIDFLTKRCAVILVLLIRENLYKKVPVNGSKDTSSGKKRNNCLIEFISLCYPSLLFH
jgi:hypothetical protein